MLFLEEPKQEKYWLQLEFDGIIYVPKYSTWKPKEDYVDQAQWEEKPY